MNKSDWRARYLAGLRTQYRAMFQSMAVGGRWHVHRGSAGLVLLRDDATLDVDLPIILRDVQAMCEQTMIDRAHAALGDIA